MAYQYLQHDGFIYRRPPPPETSHMDPDNWKHIQLWDGSDWVKPITSDIRIQPLVYGSVVSEADVKKMLGAAAVA